MMHYFAQYLPLLLFSGGLCLSFHLSASSGGGLIADGTAGTQVTSQDQILVIEGGTLQGGNLLHSFREFNIETGQTADFQAATDTQNIVSRVTGSNDSWIDGKIQSTTSGADLYLVNPNGVVFDKNASLDVKGAFHASTADYVTLEDGQRVYADPNQGVTLTVAAPAAFGFLDNTIGAIQINGSQLSVGSGQVLSLIGGEIQVVSGGLTTEGGYINLLGVDSAGEIPATGNMNNTIQLANITLTDSTLMVTNKAHSSTVGQIMIQGNQVNLSSSKVLTGNRSAIDASVPSFKVQANAIIFNDGSLVDAATQSVGKGGDLEINAVDIILADGTTIDAKTFGIGQGSAVTLTASHQVLINGSVITMETYSEEANAGQGGDLTINAVDIVLADKTTIDAKTYGTGQGSSVTLTASNRVTIKNSLITVETRDGGTHAGKGGNVMINAVDIALADEAAIDAATLGAGQGGLIRLQAMDQIRISGPKTVLNSSSHGTGASGIIDVQAASLLLEESVSMVSTSGFEHPDSDLSLSRTGAAGRILINLSDTLWMGGASQIDTSTAGSGKAGNIEIGEESRPVALWMEAGSKITSGSESTLGDAGEAGYLSILIRETVDLQGGSALTTASENAGGGGIQIETRDHIHLQDSAITTSVNGGSGGGGDIDIDPVFIILENSQIQANAHGGSGGNITLVADYLLQSGPSVIEASSALSTPGNVDVQAVNVDGGSLQAATEIDPLDVDQWQPVPCRQRRGGISRLIMAGYDAHPTPVDDLLSSLPVWARMPLDAGSQAQLESVMPVSQLTPATVFESAPKSVVQHFRLAVKGDLAGNCDVL